MDGLYFLAMLGGVAWLAWWSVGGTGWSPFAMREEPVGEPDAAPTHQAADLRAVQSRSPLPQPWRLRQKPPAPAGRKR